ncbi:trypsin-like peptidase domain-containing protein [Streptomyces cavourensis]
MTTVPSGPKAGRDSWVVSLHLTERDMRPLGSGFLIDDRRVLTCAHVVETAWNKHRELWVAFPKAEEVMGRRVRVSDVTLPSGGNHEVQDVAVLSLTEAMPPGMAARLRQPTAEDLVGTDWRSFGFPDGVLGGSVSGTVGDALGYGWMHLDTRSTGYPVKAGYSGSAVWSPAHQAVVGMVGQAHTATGDARALTVRAIDRMLPDQGLRHLVDWSLEAVDETALISWGWSLGTDPEAGRHWQPRARGVSTAAERGFRFRGRTAALREITQWMTAASPHRQVLVVTGAPGSGKSAVLGRVITTSDREIAAALPPDDSAVRAPLGIVSCAVHAKGKTALEVAQEIARAVSIPLPSQVIDLLPSLRATIKDRPGPPFTLVVDALDEAGTVDEARAVVNHILVPLAETCADLRVRVVVGTRRSDGAGDLLGTFGRAARIVDLDAPEFTSHADLTAYALSTLQLQGDGRAGNPYADSAVAYPVAERIAALADGNYLVAGLVARAHGMHDESAVDPRSMSFPVTVDASLREYLRILPDVGPLLAESLLVPLAYAESPGLTVKLWHTGLTALFGMAPSESELAVFARSSAANFLIESTAAGGTDAAFRLFHQALSESLRAARADLTLSAGDEHALACAYIADGAKAGWAAAPAYLLRSLAVHAGRGGVIDQLLDEDDYLLYADLRQLIPQARRAATDKGRQRARLLRQTPRALDAPAPERAALFSVTELQERLGATYRASAAARPYQAVWSTVPPSMEVAVLEGHTKRVNAVCSVRLGGRELLASIGGDTIRLWNPETGDTVRTFASPPGWIGSLCPVESGGTTLLAGAGQDGKLWTWNPATGEIVGTLHGHDAPVDELCAFSVDGRHLLASRGRDRRVRVWCPDSGKAVRTFRARSHGIIGMCVVESEGRPLLAFLTRGADGRSRVRLWNPLTGDTVFAFSIRGGAPEKLAAVQCEGRAFLLTGESVQDDDVITVWDCSTGRFVRELDGGQGSLYDLVGLCVRGRPLVVAGYGEEESGTIMLWDPVTGRRTHQLEGHDGYVCALSAIESGGETLIASASEDCTVRLWDLDSCAEPDVKDESGTWVGALSVLEGPDGAAVAGSGTAGEVLVRDVASGRLIDRISSHHASVTSLCAIKLGGHECLAIASRDQKEASLQIWDLVTGSAVRSLDTPGVVEVCAVEVGGKPCLVFSSYEEGTSRVSLWDPSVDQITRSAGSEEGLIRGLCALDVGGRSVVAVLTGHFGVWPEDFKGGVVSLWDPVSGEMDDCFEVPDAPFGSLCALNADDRTFLAVTRHQTDGEEDSVGNGSVWVFDPADGHRVGVQDLHSGWVNAVGPVVLFATPGMASAGQTERTVRLWAADSLRQMMEIPVRREVFSVAQAGEHLVFGLDNGGLMAVRLVQ